jgi:hypothetical protein
VQGAVKTSLHFPFILWKVLLDEGDRPLGQKFEPAVFANSFLKKSVFTAISLSLSGKAVSIFAQASKVNYLSFFDRASTNAQVV